MNIGRAHWELTVQQGRRQQIIVSTTVTTDEVEATVFDQNDLIAQYGTRGNACLQKGRLH